MGDKRRPEIPGGICSMDVAGFAEDSIRITVQLKGESDRGAALLGAAFLDDALERILRGFLLDIPAMPEFFGQNGPAGTFSARIDLAHGLGLIAQTEARDLHLVRKIRNDFAHEVFTTTFETEAVTGRCRELHHGRWAPDFKNSAPRAQFMRTMAHLGAVLQLRAHEIKRQMPRGEEALPDGAAAIRMVDALIEAVDADQLKGKSIADKFRIIMAPVTEALQECIDVQRQPNLDKKSE